VSNDRDQRERRVLGFLGVGLDHQDGHKRLTRSEHFLLVGGSEATHESMQEIAIKFSEKLDQCGKRLQDASVDEVLELFREAADA
jgi:hypothetical protein